MVVTNCLRFCIGIDFQSVEIGREVSAAFIMFDVAFFARRQSGGTNLGRDINGYQ